MIRYWMGMRLELLSALRLKEVNVSNRCWRPGKKPSVRAVYYSAMFTWGFSVKETQVLYEDSNFREIYQPLHLESHVLGLKFPFVNFTE